MKNIINILLISGLSLTLASCGAMSDGFGNTNPGNNYPNNYPNNNGDVYRAGDGAVYGRNEVYRDRNGNVYQSGRVIRQGDVNGQPGILGRNGNQTVYYPNNNQRRLPPGQAKKIYGGSAKDYAPGQLKKRNGQYNENRRYDNDDEYRSRGKNDDDRQFKDDENWNKKELKKKNKNGQRNDD